MRWPGRTIWDTRVQSVCGLISARGDDGVEIFVSATFAQVSLSPPLVIINPNRMHSIEPAVSQSGRFAINVLPLSFRDVVVKLMRMRRREPHKAAKAGLTIIEDAHNIPYVEGARRTVFCEVEAVIPGGDRDLYVGRILESRVNKDISARALLFSDLSGGAHPLLARQLRRTLQATRTLWLAKTLFARLSPQPPQNIALNTYLQAGATQQELEQILQFGTADRSRLLAIPAAPAIMKKRLGVCVVGTGWGGVHCRYLKMAGPSLQLFVCGRDPKKTAHLARAVGATDYFLDMEKAVNDPRVQALTLALPHDVHRQGVEMAADARKAVLVEKPIATTIEDADSMIRAVKKAGTILMVAEDMHFRPAVREAVKHIVRGDIGEPLYLLMHAGGIRRPQGWAAEKERMGGGVLIDIGVHYIRGLRLLMGEPDRVFATRAMQINTKMRGEDSVQVLFESRFGWQAHMLLTWSTQRGDVPDFVLAGDEGTLHLWPGRPFIDYYPAAQRVLPKAISYVRPYSLQEKLFRPWMNRIRIHIKDQDLTGYLGEMKEFIAAVAEGREPASVAADGRRDLEIVLRSYDALTAGTWLDVLEMPKGGSNG